jgi:hypothetical protein
MVDPADMIVPLLHEMRAENAALHEQARELLENLDRRLAAIEENWRAGRDRSC